MKAPASANFIDRLVRPCIGAMKPYSSARSHGEARVLLDANEYPWFHQPSEYSRYPEPQPRALVQRLAELYQVPVKNILITRGSDEAVDLLVRTFCEPQRHSIVIHPPTFEIYEHVAKIQQAPVVRAPLDKDFDLDFETMKKSITADTRVVFLCNPNNPTGNLLSPERIEQVLKLVGENALVVIDEAYVEFAPGKSWAPRLGEFPQLVILRTLSKYWSGANLRVGTTLAHPRIIEQMRKILAPYPVPAPVTEATLAHLKNLPPDLADVVAGRELISAALKKIKTVKKIWPTDANFVLLEVENAEAFCRDLLAQGVRIRNRSHLWPDSVRVSLGNPSERAALLTALETISSEVNHVR